MKKPYFLYVIDVSGVCLFSYNFKKELVLFEKEFFGGFITAISLFSAELNKTLGYSEEFGRLPSIPINITFEILISYENPVVGVIVVEKKDIDEDMNIFLNEFIKEFLLKYKDVLKDWDGCVTLFDPFKNEIERIYKKMELFSFQIPNMKEINATEFNLSKDLLAIIKEIDGQKSISEIAQKMRKTVDEIKTMISNLSWQEIITLSEKVYDDDILEPKRDLFYLIRTKVIDPQKQKLKLSDQKLLEFKILRAIDGFKTVYQLSEEFRNLNIDTIKQIISFYLSKGSYLEKVELYPQIISISDELLSKMPTESLALSYSLQNMCDGELSLSELSENTGFPCSKIKKILDLLGKNVFYKKKNVK